MQLLDVGKTYAKKIWIEIVAFAAIAKPKAHGHKNWAEERVYANLYRFAYFVSNWFFKTSVANTDQNFTFSNKNMFFCYS